MSLTLYRKYRPKTFAELTGQNHVKLTLEHQLESGKVAHAYLFTGPRGVGKTTTARLLASAVNKVSEADSTSIWEGRDLDVVEIDAASNTGVDHVREVIIENARFTPVHLKYKVFIIDEVHMLSLAAFNALLKILEEPPVHAMFILATTELHKVPATIVSRCQRFDFRKISSQDMLERLTRISSAEGVQVDNEVLLDIARRSEGCLRDAESLLGQILSVQKTHITVAEASLVLPISQFSQVLLLLDDLVRHDAEQGVTRISKALEEGVDLWRFCGDLLEMLRLLLILKISPKLSPAEIDVPAGYETQVVELSKKFSLTDIVRLIDIFSKKRLDIKTAIIPQLPLEVGIVEFCLVNAQLTTSTHKPQVPTPNNQTVTKSPISNIQSTSNIQPTNTSQSQTPPVVQPTSNIVQNQSSTPVDSSPTEISTATIDVVKSKWGVFLSRLQQLNPSLVLILKTAEPMSCENGLLIIGYKYPFHKQRVDHNNNRDIVTGVFTEVFGGSVKLENAVLPSDYVSDFIATVTQQDEVELLADAFVAENASSVANNPVSQETKKTELPQTQEDLIRNLVKVFGGSVAE